MKFEANGEELIAEAYSLGAMEKPLRSVFHADLPSMST